jgi:hypothetical protein
MRRADNLTTSGSLNLLEPSGLSRPVMGLLYLFLFNASEDSGVIHATNKQTETE